VATDMLLIRKEAEVQLATAKEHNKNSAELLLVVKECIADIQAQALKMNDGAHRMTRIEDDLDELGAKQRDHESGADGKHAHEEDMRVERAKYQRRERLIVRWTLGALTVAIGALGTLFAIPPDHLNAIRQAIIK